MSSKGYLQGFPQINAPIAMANGQPCETTQPWYQFFIALWGRTGAAQGGNTSPTGGASVFFGPVSNIPPGWLLCDGSAINRVVYAALFSVIGTSWGAGDGLTTFNIPDMRNRFPIGADNFAYASRGGSLQVTISTAQLPAHTHTVTDPGHHHTALIASSTNTAGAAAGTAVAGNTGTSMTGITIDSTGGGDPVNVVPPYAAINFLIKT